MVVLVEKEVAWFRTGPQARKEYPVDELRELGESLKVRQLQAVGAQPDGLLIWGHRRLRAAKLVGIGKLYAVILQEAITETQFLLFQAAENIHRVDLTAYEKSQVCEELRRLNPHWQAKEIAEHLKISASVVTRLLSAGRCIDTVQKAFADGVLSLNDTYAISQLPESEQPAALTLKVNGATREALTSHVRKQKSRSDSDVRLSRVVCPLPTGVSITVSGHSLSLEEVLDALAELQREVRKARDQSLDVRTLMAVLKDKSKGGK